MLALNENFMTPTDETYRGLIEDVLSNGNYKGDRTGTGTCAVVGRMARYSLLNGRSPRLTTKAMSDNPERELLWFRNGSSSIKELRDQKIGIWNSWLMPGSAKYRTKTTEELLDQIRKKYKGDLVGAIYMTAEEYAKVPDEKYTVRYEKHMVRVTHLEESGKKQVEIYGSDNDFRGLEDLVFHVAADHKIDLQVLVDGDIGPGGYGPQWRHWKDTQLASMTQLNDYRKQGYDLLGKVIPPDLPFGVENLTAALDAHLRSKGFTSTSIGDADPCMVPECGWEAVGDPEQDGHAIVMYLNEEALIDCYITLLDIPRFVMYREIDQLANAVKLLKEDPNSRRIIVTAWNPALTWKAALPPCHLYFQFISHELTLEQRIAIAQDRVELAKYDKAKEDKENGFTTELVSWVDWNECRNVTTDEDMHLRLDEVGIKRRGLYCFLLLRSNDLGLGQPFNVAQYATLTHMVAQVTDMEALELVWTAVDAHVYANHVDALREQLELESKECIPRIVLTKGITDIDAFTISDIKIIDHEMHKALSDKMPVAV